MHGCGGWSVPGITDEKIYYRKAQKRFYETYSPVCWTKSLNRLQIKSPLPRSEAITQNQPRAEELHKGNGSQSAASMQNRCRKISIFLASLVISYTLCAKSKGCVSAQPYTVVTRYTSVPSCQQNVSWRSHAYSLGTVDWDGHVYLHGVGFCGFSVLKCMLHNRYS